MSFIETQFPTDVSSGSRGGPGFNTGVMTVDSGHERRRIRWPLPRHKYDVAYGIRTAAQLEVVLDFFYAMQGKAYGFRYRDPLDHKTGSYSNPVADNEQVLLASAAGGETDIQLFKTYTRAGQSVNRIITKPVTSTVLVAVNSSPLTEGVNYSVDTTTGMLTLFAPLNATDLLTCGFEFDVPCRFDTDTLSIQLRGAVVGDTEIPVIEVRV